MTPPSPQTDRLTTLVARQAIVDLITTLFVATDERDWNSVQACFTPEVYFDMTSLAGGEPRHRAAADIVNDWELALRPIDQMHHQVGNFRVGVAGATASASCYGIAYHYRRNAPGGSTRVFVGTYNFGLREERGEWRISSFRFTARFVEGNQQLEA